MKALLHLRELTKHYLFRHLSLRDLLFRLNPLWVQLHYFLVVSLLGFLALRASEPRSGHKPKDLDLFFTSVSAASVSSMSTVEMEVFSNTQLVIITLLMLVGGEVFTSMLGLLIRITHNHTRKSFTDSSFVSSDQDHEAKQVHDHDITKIEMGLVSDEDKKPNTKLVLQSSTCSTRRTKSMKCLVYVVLSYLILVQVGGYVLVHIYTSLVPSANQVLVSKGISPITFSAFTSVSTFTNCGFIPTNENMVVFSKNSGLLLLLIPTALLGNTFYAPSLRFAIWVLEKITNRQEMSDLLRNGETSRYNHLMSGARCLHVAAANFVVLLLQLVFFTSFEWNSNSLDGFNSRQKLAGSVFQVVNSRHTGESVVDLSTVSSAVLVVFIVAMYLPPYYTPFSGAKRTRSDRNDQRKKLGDYLKFSKLSYLMVFIILICITERNNMKEDPLNFNVLNITLEVVSAYGNVGFSTGYSCKRRLIPDNDCRDAWYGFVGRWSNKGKLVLIVVMLFGRLKNYIPTP